VNRRDFLNSTMASMAAAKWQRAQGKGAPVRFEPTWESLAQYQVPEWFRDAKFGIWAHWSAQCVPEQGDWYARLMYIQGEPAYQHHLKTYGHPSRSGFMQMNHLWKAESWSPDELMGLYRRAGAKYFMALANHHDNFDAFDSTHHAWNSVRIGPRKDIVGTWAKAARAAGLRFAVSNHSAHAWHWFQTAYGYDAEGELAGVRYDAATLTREAGKGTWWEGLDPKDLYGGPSMVMPKGLRTIQAVKQWHAAHDGVWTEAPPPNDPKFIETWSLRCRDLLEKYQPDLLYFDNSGLPLGQAGLDMAAWYYNASQRWNDGHLEAVITGKELKGLQQQALVEDMERGFSDTLRPRPWQTDTCIGNWHYDTSIFQRHGYKSAAEVITRLCDVVSKNGNLMLSVPIRGNGTIDADERAILEALAAWMKTNGEAIFSSRPWRRFGEGPTQVKGGMFAESKAAPFTAEDIRFTVRAGELYAIALGRPTGASITIHSLAASAGEVHQVRLLGEETALQFRMRPEGLTIELPKPLPESIAYAFKISGRGLI
jgi:alpha-L-fucosidase